MKNLTTFAPKGFANAIVLGLATMTTGIVVGAAPTHAANLSVVGNLNPIDPNDKVSVSFTADGISTVTIRSYSYGGGTNDAGTPISATGFDPNLTLFDSAGNWYTDRDDDVLLDFQFSGVLPAGNYQAVVAAFGNNSAGFGNLSTLFAGMGTFDTVDPITNNPVTRSSAYAFDILNVNNTTSTAVPEPASLIGTTLAGLAAVGLRRKLASGKKTPSKF
jgi:hypothetical protein